MSLKVVPSCTWGCKSRNKELLPPQIHSIRLLLAHTDGATIYIFLLAVRPVELLGADLLSLSSLTSNWCSQITLPKVNVTLHIRTCLHIFFCYNDAVTLHKIKCQNDINTLYNVDFGIVIPLCLPIDICFYHQSEHNTLNTTHSSIFYNMFRPSLGRVAKT